MTNEEREKKTRIANMLIGTIKDLRTPMLMYQVEKDVAKEALENYIKALEQQPTKPTASWKKFDDDYIKCSKCERIVKFYHYNYRYCPHCGARMTESEDEE